MGDCRTKEKVRERKRERVGVRKKCRFLCFMGFLVTTSTRLESRNSAEEFGCQVLFGRNGIISWNYFSPGAVFLG